MRFLVDNQLPQALCLFLKERGFEAIHVLELGLHDQSDSEIWSFAQKNQFIVVSKDEDFFHLANRLGEGGRLLWVRIGNCRKAYLTERFSMSFEAVRDAFEQGARIVELR